MSQKGIQGLSGDEDSSSLWWQMKIIRVCKTQLIECYVRMKNVIGENDGIMQDSCCLANQGHSSAIWAAESEVTMHSFTNLRSDSIVEQLISQFTNKRLTLGSQQRRKHPLILPCKILLTHSTKGVCFLANAQLSLVFNYKYKWWTSIVGTWANPSPYQICKAALIRSIITCQCTTLSAQSGFPKHGSGVCRIQGYLCNIEHLLNVEKNPAQGEQWYDLT